MVPSLLFPVLSQPVGCDLLFIHTKGYTLCFTSSAQVLPSMDPSKSQTTRLRYQQCGVRVILPNHGQNWLRCLWCECLTNHSNENVMRLLIESVSINEGSCAQDTQLDIRSRGAWSIFAWWDSLSIISWAHLNKYPLTSHLSSDEKSDQ